MVRLQTRILEGNSKFVVAMNILNDHMKPKYEFLLLTKKCPKLSSFYICADNVLENDNRTIISSCKWLAVSFGHELFHNQFRTNPIGNDDQDCFLVSRLRKVKEIMKRDVERIPF
jgi:hypothetical protein